MCGNGYKKFFFLKVRKQKIKKIKKIKRKAPSINGRWGFLCGLADSDQSAWCDLQVGVIFLPLLNGRNDAEVDNLLAHVAEVLV